MRTDISGGLGFDVAYAVTVGQESCPVQRRIPSVVNPQQEKVSPRRLKTGIEARVWVWQLHLRSVHLI